MPWSMVLLAKVLIQLTFGNRDMLLTVQDDGARF